MKLYVHPLSGHAHRARLFLSLLGLDYEEVQVDLAKGEHKREPFLKLNFFGQVPVLVDSDVVISDSVAILVYLARREQREDWLPADIVKLAAVQRWLSVAAGELAYGPGAARLVNVFAADFRPEEVIARAHAILALIEEQLSRSEWIASEGHPTIADIALYSYIVNAPEGNVDLSVYTRIGEWLARIEQLDGFVPFQTTEAGLRIAS